MIRILLFLFCILHAQEEVFLKVPNLSREHVIGTNVGIRPYRKSGVRIEAENFEDKLIIHNYVYGGSGITLSLGGAKEVVRLLEGRRGTVAVLGAGVIGFATAYDLLNAGYEVHLYADAWEGLTSHVAAGIWSPMVPPEDATEEKKNLIERIHVTSHERFSSFEFAGVRWIDSYSFITDDYGSAIKTKGRGDSVIAHFDNGVTKKGKKVREIGIDGKVFLEDLREKVIAKDASFVARHFSTKEELLALEEPIIVNCTSIGSRELFGDSEFLPTRGQIVYFQPQEGFDYLFFQSVPDSTTTWVSIYPWNDRIVLGGIYEKGEEERVINPLTIDMLIDNAQKCLEGK